MAALPSGRDALAKTVALVVSLVVLALTIVMCAAFEPGGDRFQFVQAHDWIPAFGVQYAVGADGIALVLIALIAVLVPVVVLASWYDADPHRRPAAPRHRRRRCGCRRDDDGRRGVRRREQPAGRRERRRRCSTRPRPRSASRSTSCRRAAA